MTHTPEPLNDDEVEHTRDVSERDRERRTEDTERGEGMDPREERQPPQPFSGAEH
ncbi:MAG: hypothetical protein HOV79_12095 [Hamadaea sp.]|nr:hypothetical protein [Hamadaea sp.]